MLLTELYPRRRDRRRYSSLAILGEILEGYARWLFDQGYPRYRVHQHFRAVRRLDQLLSERGTHDSNDLSRDRLQACAPASRLDDPELAMIVGFLDRYLEGEGIFPSAPPTRIEAKGAAYRLYLERVRGLAPSTGSEHTATVAEFLEYLHYEEDPTCLTALTRADLEAFVCKVARRRGRASLQHTVAHLRAFLRFLAVQGEAPTGLDTQIDTPRVYRGEQLPRSLPWETVCALLQSIDRSTPKGRRDYAMFLLMATYGLRTCEVVALTLNDIEWRAGRIHVSQGKTANCLVLPLTDEVGASLLDYLQHGRPPLPLREVFLRCEAPPGVLRPSAVGGAFRRWTARSGLNIPFQGPHCLRHSYAVHLLREGTPLKVIGDILGHRSAESTCVYLRLSIDDLREVALPLPHAPTGNVDREVVA